MDTSEFPYQLMEILSDAMALMDQNGVVEYFNGAFQRLYEVYNPLYDPLRKMPCQELLNLNSGLYKSGDHFISERVSIPSTDQTFHVFVYSLDNLGLKKSLSLFLFKMGGQNDEPESISVEEVVNAFIEEKNVLSGKLDPEFQDLIGEDPHFITALINAQKAAKTELPILIIGESGTGKELLAQATHRASARGKKAFVDINSATLPDNLIESELFGYERGAFTGARREGKRGLFDQAHEGSIFMDEIGEASPHTQSKILRVLQEGQFKRIGGSRNIRVDVRLISATNKDLTNLIVEGRFREDLFYRLNTITITLPPLRERQTDLRLLVDHFLMEYADPRRQDLRFSPDSMALLESYEWPGNVRELKGVVDYAATMATGSLLSPESLPSFLYKQGKAAPEKSRQVDLSHFMAADNKGLLTSVVQQVEKDLIRKVLERSRNRTEAIKTLGISRRTFYAKIKQYGLG